MNDKALLTFSLVGNSRIPPCLSETTPYPCCRLRSFLSSLLTLSGYSRAEFSAALFLFRDASQGVLFFLRLILFHITGRPAPSPPLVLRRKKILTLVRFREVFFLDVEGLVGFLLIKVPSM